MAKQEAVVINIEPVNRRQLPLAILGVTPLICETMSEKARRELIDPSGRKTAADRAMNVKHNPLEEYQASVYTLPDDTAPTAIGLMASAFKKAMMTAALDLPNAKKAQIGRLVYVEGNYTPIFGKPQLFQSVVRSANIDRTPDIRTRAILPRWACQLMVHYVVPMLSERAIMNLLAAAGQICGVGGWRVEKGAGNYGQFALVNPNDPEYLEVLREGRAVQQEALQHPEMYDQETARLVAWWRENQHRRGREVPVFGNGANGAGGELAETVVEA